MVRFLSEEWFAAVSEQTSETRTGRGDGQAADPLVLEQVVTGSPDGNVRYFVIIENGAARISTTSSPVDNADVTITCAWETATAIAKGELSSQTALMQGKLRVRGNLSKLSGRAGDLAGLDPVPEPVRKTTTF